MAASPVGMKRFYTMLGGGGRDRHRLSRLPALQAGHGEHSGERHDAPADTAGFRGYVKGSDRAPVEITEYADYQCPFCQTFATLQMPTIEERLIKTGRLRWRYRDFPLQQHPFSRRRGAFRRLRRRAGQVLAPARADLRGPVGVGGRAGRGADLPAYARRGRARPGKYDACMSAGKYAGRIQASYDEGMRAGRELDARPCSSAAGSTRAASTPTPSPGWSTPSRRAPAPDDLPHGRGAHEPRGALRVSLPVPLQDRPDRHARLRHRRM